MKKAIIFQVALLLLIGVVGLSFISPSSVEDEFRKLSNYAGDYETGNINYVQLLVHLSAIREEMNGILGVTGKEIGGILKEEQLKSVLGEPTETTRWVWAESEEREVRLDKEVSVWRKVIFDGRKIQIRMNAWPSIFGMKKFEGENKNEALKELEGKIVYRLHTEIEFKKPQEQVDVEGKIEEIKALAQTFSSNPSRENAEALAKESVNAERMFESYFKQNGGKCEDIMSSIFGSENRRQTQKMLVQEISLCSGDNFEVIARIEMCDDCEWNWVNLDVWVEGRGPGFKFEEEKKDASQEEYKDMNPANIESEIKWKVDEIKNLCSNGDYKSIMKVRNDLWPLNEAWNRKSNDVWKEIEQIFNSQRESMTQEQRQQFDQNYGWIKEEQEKRKKVKEISKLNHEKRKQFYSELFSGYDKKEHYFTQVEYQKRLVEEFREKGQEICNNNQDDNGNQAIDCADEQCGGSICGRGKKVVQEGNETKEVDADFYCIEKECKAKEEYSPLIINTSAVICQELPPIECPEGSKAFFSRYDNETNCPVETSCLEETDSCEVSEDCRQPACGIAECVEGECKVTSLTECRETECVDGDEKICNADGKITEICTGGFWEKIGECEEEAEIREEVIVGAECLSASDCGSDNVCNNGICQVLPQVIVSEKVEEETTEEPVEEVVEEKETGEEFEIPILGKEDLNEQEAEEANSEEAQPAESMEEDSESSQQSESEEGGVNVVINSFVGLFSKMTGAGITGFESEEGETASEVESAPEEQESSESSSEEPAPEEQEQESQEQPSDDEDDGERDEEERREQEKERREREEEQREKENRERCENDCERPCIEKCIREECGEELDCVVDSAREKCEGTCEAEDSCVEKCMKGEGEWWKEFENKEEFKEEKGGFQAGGNCRTSQGKTEGFIWFGGWGEQFEKIQVLKSKYYSGGQMDWCKYEFENLKKQRQEFEKGFNQEFVAWFFEKHLANSAENWEQAVSGIYELYWKDVDNSREMIYKMQCLESDELPSVNLINVQYDTKYGSIEFWEEIKTTKLEGMEEEVQIISPYMKVWVFPTREFMIYEMKQSMKEHRFPGSSKQSSEEGEGPKEEEQAVIKQDEKFMKEIRKISEKYGGDLDVIIQLKDSKTSEVVFNLYAQVNEEEIVRLKPMLPEENPPADVQIEIDFDTLYNLIYETEKEMSGERLETPPWDKEMRPVEKIKEIKEGIKIYFKIRGLINSAKITPAEAEDDLMDLFKKFMFMMMRTQGGDSGEGGDEDKTDEEKEQLKEDVFGSKEGITGEKTTTNERTKKQEISSLQKGIDKE